MADESWWRDRITDEEWEARKQRAEEYSNLLMEQEHKEQEARMAWYELTRGKTSEEIDAYVFNLTKLGSTAADIARSFGLSSLAHRVRRHKRRLAGEKVVVKVTAKRDRNEQMLREREEGKSYRAIAKLHGITACRVRQIIHKLERDRQRKAQRNG